MLKQWMDHFLQYLQAEHNASEHTVRHYSRDIRQFHQFMKQNGLKQYDEVTYLHVRSYLAELQVKEYARRSIARKLSALRSFYMFLLREQVVRSSPFQQVQTPKLDKKLPKFMYPEEVKQLLQLLIRIRRSVCATEPSWKRCMQAVCALANWSA